MKRYITLCTLIFLGLLSHQENAGMVQAKDTEYIEAIKQDKIAKKNAKNQEKRLEDYDKITLEEYENAKEIGLAHTSMEFNQEDAASPIQGATMTNKEFQLEVAKVVNEAKSTYAREILVDFKDDIRNFAKGLAKSAFYKKDLTKRISKKDRNNIKNKQYQNLVQALITNKVSDKGNDLLQTFNDDVKVLDNALLIDFIEKIANNLDKIGEDFYSQLLETGKEWFQDKEMSNEDQMKLFDHGLDNFHVTANPTYTELLEAEHNGYAEKFTPLLIKATQDADEFEIISDEL